MLEDTVWAMLSICNEKCNVSAYGAYQGGFETALAEAKRGLPEGHNDYMVFDVDHPDISKQMYNWFLLNGLPEESANHFSLALPESIKERLDES